MAARTRRNDSEDAGSHPRRAPARKQPPFVGIALLLLVVAAAVVLFAMTSKKPTAAAPTVEKKDPFADLPPELPPEKQAKTKGELQRDQQKAARPGQ